MDAKGGSIYEIGSAPAVALASPAPRASQNRSSNSLTESIPSPHVIYVEVHDPWSPINAISAAVIALLTVVLAIMAVVAYQNAVGQLKALLGQVNEMGRISKVERTADLLAEWGSDSAEELFGFFDISSDPTESHAATNDLYWAIVVAQRPEEDRKQQPITTVDEVTVNRFRSDLDRLLAQRMARGARPNDGITDQGEELRRMIVSIDNLCERTWALIANNVVDEKIFFQPQDYNVVATYFFLRDALEELSANDGFDFDDFKHLALRAQKHYRSRNIKIDELADADFS
jgi:hypothetical protein